MTRPGPVPGKRGGDHSAEHTAQVLACRQYLAWLRCWEFKVAGGLYQRPGVPDILACVPPSGHLLAVEVKTAGGRLSSQQMAEMLAIRGAGGVAIVVANVDDLETALLAHGLTDKPLLVTRQMAAQWMHGERPLE